MNEYSGVSYNEFDSIFQYRGVWSTSEQVRDDQNYFNSFMVGLDALTAALNYRKTYEKLEILPPP